MRFSWDRCWSDRARASCRARSSSGRRRSAATRRSDPVRSSRGPRSGGVARSAIDSVADRCILSDDAVVDAGTHAFRSVLVGNMRAEPETIVEGAAEPARATSQEFMRRLGRLWSSATWLRSPAATINESLACSSRFTTRVTPAAKGEARLCCLRRWARRACSSTWSACWLRPRRILRSSCRTPTRRRIRGVDSRDVSRRRASSAGPANLADAFPRFELSDAFLVLDPRSLPIGDFQLSALTRAYAAEPRVALHFVTFETAIGGTKEKVSFDPTRTGPGHPAALRSRHVAVHRRYHGQRHSRARAEC